jgi:hypothetical protein
VLNRDSNGWAANCSLTVAALLPSDLQSRDPNKGGFYIHQSMRLCFPVTYRAATVRERSMRTRFPRSVKATKAGGRASNLTMGE